MYRAGVDLEMNVVVLDLNIGNVGGIARLNRWPPKIERLLQLFATRCNHALFQQQSLCAHGKGRPRIYQLGFKVADDFITSLLRYALGIRRDWTGDRWILRFAGIAHLTVS